MANVGLIDVDSHNFPNLALMKISAYEKNRGNEVEWWNGLKVYDRVYKAKVFDETYTTDNDYCIMADEVIRGGTGYDLENVLPAEIEHQYPDYSIYPQYTKNTAYGFITRGCPRGCKFCIVEEKEGRESVQVAELDEFWKGQGTVKLLDPNVTACENSEAIFDSLIKSKAWIDFTQGLDARLITDKHVWQLNKMRLKRIHFAWDNYEFNTYEQLKKIRQKLTLSDRRSGVYVLTNFNTTHEQDVERVEKLKELGYDPYVMIFNKPSAPRETKRLQRYCNNKFIFRSCSFEEYGKMNNETSKKA